MLLSSGNKGALYAWNLWGRIGETILITFYCVPDKHRFHRFLLQSYLKATQYLIATYETRHWHQKYSDGTDKICFFSKAILLRLRALLSACVICRYLTKNPNQHFITIKISPCFSHPHGYWKHFLNIRRAKQWGRLQKVTEESHFSPEKTSLS